MGKLTSTLKGVGIGSGIAGIGLLLNSLERAKNKRDLEKEKKNKIKLIYLPKKAAVKTKKETTEEKEIKRTFKKGSRDIRGKFFSTKQADPHTNPAVEGAKQIMLGTGGALGGYLLINKLGKMLRSKKLTHQIDKKRQEYVNKVLLQKEGEDNDKKPGFFGSAGNVLSGLGQAWNGYMHLLPRVGGKESTRLASAILALGGLGYAGTTWATKKFLDNRYGKHDKNLARKPIQNKIVFRHVDPEDPEEADKLQKDGSAREAYLTVLALEMAKQAGTLKELSVQVNKDLTHLKEADIIDVLDYKDVLLKQAVLDNTFYKEGSFHNSIYKQAFLPLLKVMKWNMASKLLGKGKGRGTSEKPPEVTPIEEEFKLNIETDDPALADSIKQNIGADDDETVTDTTKAKEPKDGKAKSKKQKDK